MHDPDPIITDEQLGARVHYLRKNRTLTQEQLARRAALSPDTIRRLERGEFSPSFDTLIKTAAGLDIPLIAMICDTYDEADDVASIARGLPEQYRRLALLILVTLYVDVVQPKGLVKAEIKPITRTRRPIVPTEPTGDV